MRASLESSVWPKEVEALHEARVAELRAARRAVNPPPAPSAPMAWLQHRQLNPSCKCRDCLHWAWGVR